MKTPPRIAALAVTLLAVAACRDPAANVTRATTGAAAPTSTTPTPTAARTEHLAFATATSRVQFVGSKVTASHEGAFSQFAGTLEFVPDHVESSRIHIDIEMASLSIAPAQLADHLRGPAFFDVPQFPRATFDSTEIRAGGAGGATHTVTGNLTLHGQTRAVTFPVTVTAATQEVAARSEFSINRRDFGIVYPGMANDLIRDNVVIRLDMHAPRVAAR